jgi:hypothetical protein
MAYLGNAPTSVPLSSADLQDGIITTAKIANGAVIGADINSTFDLTGKTVTLPTGTGGKVLQVITAIDTTTRSTTSTSFVTGSNSLSISITPSSSSNKIFLVSSFAFYSSNEGYFTFFRGATNLATNSDLCLAFFKGVSYGSLDSQQATISFLDSPSSTSSLTYQVYLRRGASGTAYLNNGGQGTITAFEIAG